MAVRFRTLVVRLLPVLFIIIAAAAWFNDVQDDSRYLLRNLIPPFTIVLLSVLTLLRGGGEWTGAGWRMPLATLGFSIPALGLAVYLHYAYAVNLDGFFDDGAGQIFRFLPIYTFFAGIIGFAIGWIVGRNI